MTIGLLGMAQSASMDRIQGIRLFIRVVDLGSFSKAAANMGVGQPAATKLVAQLEASMGARLLHRSTHGVTPTEVGLLYYEKCKLIVHHVDEADSVAALMRSQIQGALRINTSVAFGRQVLAPLVMKFMRLNPALHIDLSFDDPYLNLVEQGIDVAIRMGRLADSTLGARYLGTNPWVTVASPEYLNARGVPNRPADLVGHDALVYSSVQGDARWHFTGNAEVVTIPVKGRFRSNNLSTLLAAAREGMGVAILPRYVAEEALHSAELHCLLPQWTLPAQEIHAVFPSPRLVPAKVTEFVAWLEGKFSGTWWVNLAGRKSAQPPPDSSS
jgi:DNA-binding transcriptional LysR family regulator